MSPQQKMYAPEIILKTIKIMNRLLVIDQQGGVGKKKDDYFKMLLQKNAHNITL